MTVSRCRAPCRLLSCRILCRHAPQAYGYYASGSDDQWTLRENKEALQRYRLLPRMLVDVSQVDTSTTLLGERPL